jgi:molecular chaperone GrpE (heat shock protein)
MSKEEKETKKKTPLQEQSNSFSAPPKENQLEKKVESKEPKAPVLEPTRDENPEQLKKEISDLKQEKENLLRMLAKMDNQQKSLQEQMIKNYK